MLTFARQICRRLPGRSRAIYAAGLLSFLLLGFVGAAAGANVPVAPVVRAPKATTNAPVLLPKALAGPMRGIEEFIFCTRTRYEDGHWYANIGYYCDDEQKKAYPGNGKPDDSGLFKWNLRTGKLTTLLNAQGGTIRDPQVHYDGGKILFSWRKAGTDFFHLYEMNTDGSGLKQLTSG